ncbi:MAG: DUF3772 domain-containing protein [Nitratireductor sp.]|nr:DUF3772 domain-containing protein [Nitratireductor sp.]
MYPLRALCHLSAWLVCINLAFSPASAQTVPNNPPAGTSETAPQASGTASAATPAAGQTSGQEAAPPPDTRPDTSPQTFPETPVVDAARSDITRWTSSLDTMLQALEREGVSDAELIAFIEDSGKIQGEVSTTISAVAPVVERLTSQLAQLGDGAKEGESESEDLRQRRDQLKSRLASADAALKEARLVLLRAQQVESSVLSKRRERFVSSLSVRSNSILEPALWQRSIAGLPSFFRSIGIVTSESVRASISRMAAQPGGVMIMTLQAFIAFGVFMFFRRLTIISPDRTSHSPSDSPISYEATHAGHLLEFIRTGLLPAVLLLVLKEIVFSSGYFADRFVQLAVSVMNTLALFLAAIALLRIFLRPLRPELRIADLTDLAARRVFSTGFAALGLVAVMRVLNSFAVNLLAPFEVSIVLSGLLAFVAIMGCVRMLLVVGEDRASRPRKVLAPSGLVRWRYLRPVVWLAIICSATGLLTGYVALSEFIAYQIIAAMLVLTLTWLILRVFDDQRERMFDVEGGSLQRASDMLGMQPKSVQQMAILGFGFLRLIVVLLATFSLLLPWGIQTQDWFALVNRAFFGFQLGGLTISVSAILMALALFAIGIFFTRTVQAWVGNQFLPTTRMDKGLQNSLTTVFGYVGLVIALLVAISAAGLDLSNLAIVAGALSVGIGFGLQSIVGNFVSGLILLAERPIKAGDWVVTGGGEGTVRRISVRSTEIETFDNATIILPNQTLITDPVVNWTHRNKLGRIIIQIGVGYSSDPHRVREILLECANAHLGILAKPAPMVVFTDFGADALMFELRGWLSDIGDGLMVKSDLRFAILAALREEGVEIPFAQRDIHIRSGLEAFQQARQPARTAVPTQPRARPKAGDKGKE